MAYKLVCTQEFFDAISDKMINRGDEIYDYTHIAKLVADNREHQFVKVWLVSADGQWEWPPKLPTNAPAPPPAPESTEAEAEAEE